MFERFTERARQVVVKAQEEARGLGHDYIGTEHLLLGLLGVEEGLAGQVLESLGVGHERVRAEIERIVGLGEARRAVGQIPFTPRAKKVLELSLREALGLGHDYIGTEHILLGLLRDAREGEGVAARILVELEVDDEQVRAKLVELLPGLATPGRPRSLPRFRRRAVLEMLPTGGQWEYRVERADLLDPERQDWLNTLGAEGWELVAVVPRADGAQLVFKRPCRPARRAVG